MNARQMQVEFERNLQKKDPKYEIREKVDTENIFYVINLAQERYLKNKYLFNVPPTEQTREFVQKRADDLRKITKREEVSVTAGTIQYSVTASLPGDYLFYVRSDSYLTRDFLYPEGGSAYWMPNKPITHYEVEKVMTTPFNKPILRNPLIVFEEETEVNVYHDQHTEITNMAITYIRKPKLITPEIIGTLYPADTFTNECELAEHTHEEIIDLAVRIFLYEMTENVNAFGDNTAKDRTQKQ